MTSLSPVSVAAVLSERFGLPLKSQTGSDVVSSFLKLLPAHEDENESFSIVVRSGWRSLELAYVPGTFSAALVRAMGEASIEQRNLFRDFARSVLSDSGRITMLVNGSEVIPTDDATWPPTWFKLSISIKKAPTELTLDDREHVVIWAGRLLGMILSLAPIEEDVSGSASPQGEFEGSASRVEVNRYERSHLNRALCIQLKGTRCVACGLDFGERYGELAAGFIHVHHVIPVSQLGPDYSINPATDLEPVCPNCHSVIHRSNPPLTIRQLQEIVRRQRELRTGMPSAVAPAAIAGDGDDERVD